MSLSCIDSFDFGEKIISFDYLQIIIFMYFIKYPDLIFESINNFQNTLLLFVAFSNFMSIIKENVRKNQKIKKSEKYVALHRPAVHRHEEVRQEGGLIQWEVHHRHNLLHFQTLFYIILA